MPDLLVLLGFVPAALALNLTPGADMMFCAGQGLRNGHRAGWWASAGVATGGLIHAGLAGLGVAALMEAHPALFDVIRWLGAAYLLVLAWQSLQNGAARSGKATAHPYRDGLLVNLSNPKVILFILAFVPQFIDPERTLLGQFLVFGLILSLGGFIVNGCAGMLAGQFATRRSGPVPLWLRALPATIFAGLALRLVLTERS